MSGTKVYVGTFDVVYGAIISCMLNAARVYEWNEWRLKHKVLCTLQLAMSEESVQRWRLTKPSGRSGMFFSGVAAIDYVIILRLSGTPGPSCMFHRTGEAL